MGTMFKDTTTSNMRINIEGDLLNMETSFKKRVTYFSDILMEYDLKVLISDVKKVMKKLDNVKYIELSATENIFDNKALTKRFLIRIEYSTFEVTYIENNDISNKKIIEHDIKTLNKFLTNNIKELFSLTLKNHNKFIMELLKK